MKSLGGITCTIFLVLQICRVLCAPTNDNASQANVCNMELRRDNISETSKCVCLLLNADCSSMKIKTLPLLMNFPRGIVTANFRENNIESLRENTFASSGGLIEMDFSHNRIQFVSDKFFSPFVNLQSLKLSHNRLWNFPWNFLHGLMSLKRLDLSFNQLNQLFTDTFMKSQVLEDLNLKGNPLHELEPRHFEHLSNLRSLDLESVMMAVVPDRLFADTPKLKMLTLANNLLTVVPSDALKPLTDLKHLDLSGNPIESIGPDAFSGLNKLLVLRIDRMPKLTTIGPHAFSNLNLLTELHCSYNFFLSKIDEDAFLSKSDGKRISVNQLFLRQNNLERLSPNLMKWSRNMDVDLSGNPWDCRCHAQWLVHLKTKTNFQDHIWCASPKELEGRSVDSLRDKELPCGMSFIDIAAIATGCLLTLILLISLIAIFMHRRRSVMMYSKPDYEVYRRTTDEDVVYEKKNHF